MIKQNKRIYTKTGDRGATVLINGEPLPKNSLVFEVLGTLDELNASLGLVVLKFKQTPKTSRADLFLRETNLLIDLQNELFKLGAEIALSPTVKLNNQFVATLEQEIDFLQDDIGANWGNKFVLPGGSEIGAFLDLARTIARRLERKIVALNNERDLREIILQFNNRVSDYLYTLRIWVNKELQVKEIEFQA
ncbi:MAG TPA: cob(I)yrinic acid a,c-diamide adenosyltransferase [Candidatus Woesebacteria bacterium]|nr:cob(I)yrinic acid a,c-diamide adenosyltransferase [Candidatus Woesebacteria bacterium]